MAKKIDLDLAYEFLGEEPPEPAGDKKSINAEKKKIKELRENHPVSITVSFKIPWWVWPDKNPVNCPSKSLIVSTFKN